MESHPNQKELDLDKSQKKKLKIRITSMILDVRLLYNVLHF